MTFSEFDFQKELHKAIDEAGFTEPSPIQQEAIPIILRGKDIVAQAQTGTGKTAAFGLPVLNMMKKEKGVQGIVICPTRELAMQVSDEIFKFGKFLNISTATVYGGQSYSRQLKHIETAGIIVATPGRLIDLLKTGKINIKPSFVILDEADEMLDMGFLDDIKEIFTFMPEDRQTLLFSATMPAAIRNLAKTILKEPEFITLTKKNITNDNITQSFYVVDEYERDDALIRLYDYKNPTKSIIFCRTKKEVDRLSTFLVSQGYSAKGLHGDMEQRQREEAIRAFKKSSLEVLVATDVAARGLDVNDVSHVFNYHLPFDSESYVHRIGRTGRAGKKGVAVSIVTPHEFRMIQRIQKDTGSNLEAKVIPNINLVREKKTNSLVGRVKEQESFEAGMKIVEMLKEEFDLSTIAYKLAAMLVEDEKVTGNNFIGKSASDIERLFERMKNQKDDGGRGGRGQGHFRNRNRGGSRGDSRGGSRESRGGSRDSGSRDSRGGSRDSRGGSRDSSSRSGSRDSRGGSRDSGSRDSRNGSRESRDRG